jgi:hypothetical protein
MNQQEVADLVEIHQIAARYMAFSARKEQDMSRWLEVFTADGEYNAFGTPYGLDEFPMLLNSAPPGQYIGNMPVVEFHGDTATGVQHYVFIDQTNHKMRLAWYSDEYVRTENGWRIRKRATTFMRRDGSYDHGNEHDPARYVGGKETQ